MNKIFDDSSIPPKSGGFAPSAGPFETGAAFQSGSCRRTTELCVLSRQFQLDFTESVPDLEMLGQHARRIEHARAEILHVVDDEAAVLLFHDDDSASPFIDSPMKTD